MFDGSVMTYAQVLRSNLLIGEKLRSLTFGTKVTSRDFALRADDDVGSCVEMVTGSNGVPSLAPGDSASQVVQVMRSGEEVLQLCDGLLSRGLGEDTVRHVLAAFCGVQEESSQVAESSVASLCASTVSARSQRRADYLERVDALANAAGYCYLWLVRGSKREQVSEILGPRPTLSQLFRLPVAWLATREWRKVRVACVGENEFHLWWGPAAGSKEGWPLLGVVRATDEAFPRTVPEVWRAALAGPSAGPALPLVARFGSAGMVTRDLGQEDDCDSAWYDVGTELLYTAEEPVRDGSSGAFTTAGEYHGVCAVSLHDQSVGMVVRANSVVVMFGAILGPVMHDVAVYCARGLELQVLSERSSVVVYASPPSPMHQPSLRQFVGQREFVAVREWVILRARTVAASVSSARVRRETVTAFSEVSVLGAGLLALNSGDVLAVHSVSGCCVVGCLTVPPRVAVAVLLSRRGFVEVRGANMRVTRPLRDGNQSYVRHCS